MGGLWLLDYGAGNVASLANSVRSLGFEFEWIKSVDDFAKADRILFPGVGSFGSAMKSLEAKGFAQPLKDYIASGKPYMGICIGIQVLFESSAEAPGVAGLGVIPAHVTRFSSDDGKTVPCMGWNGAVEIRAEGREIAERYGIADEGRYYFVHSFRATLDDSTKDWALTATQYGTETYVSSIQRGNIFATQFHPEKSGAAGLAVLKGWLEATAVEGADLAAAPTTPLRPQAELDADLDRKGFTKRIVACLDVRTNDAGDLVVTKGDQYDVREAEDEPTPSTSTIQVGGEPVTFTAGVGAPATVTPSSKRDVRNLGKPVDLARRYFAEGADEVAFLNITSFRACPMHDQPMLDVVRQAAETVFVPLTIGGGIKDTVDPDGTPRPALEVAGTYFRCGADKVSIGSDAVFAVEALQANGNVPTGKSSIETISYAYGNQAVVVSFDPKRVYANSIDEVPEAHRPSVVDLAAPLPGSSTPLKDDLGPNGEQYCWYQCTVQGGREVRDMDVVQLAHGVEKLGAGEILLNSVDRDGSKAGFDLRLVALVRRSVNIPVVASSGAGKVEDFSEVFRETGVEAALAAGIFHRKEVPIADVKKHLLEAGVKVRNEKVVPY